ncbi:MAG TPA: hypothetical protein VLI55_14665 [Bryobacteraceae bacterium]|nr:hypothetical protein [Bryobacteraceae bacterium]
MSAAAQTRIFGMRVGIDPKILAGGLIAVAVVLFWYNLRGEGGSTPAVTRPHSSATPATNWNRRTPVTRRQARANDRGTLRLRPVDPTTGNVDPTLRLDLLARVQAVPAVDNMRNLFETGPTPQQAAEQMKQLHGPNIVPAALPPQAVNQSPGASAAALNIPLKYYGFAKPAAQGQQNRGFFLDGDNVLVAIEGELLDQRYLVVELTPDSARLEDTQVKQGQTLALVAEAMPE